MIHVRVVECDVLPPVQTPCLLQGTDELRSFLSGRALIGADFLTRCPACFLATQMEPWHCCDHHLFTLLWTSLSSIVVLLFHRITSMSTSTQNG